MISVNNEYKNMINIYRKGMITAMSKYCGYMGSGRELSVIKNECVLYAIKLAYKDAQRTFNGISSKQHAHRVKENAFNKLAGKIKDYFAKESPSQGREEFSEKLSGYRNCLIKDFQDYEISITTGQAQKIVNMTFKNLYCYGDAEKYEKHFLYCHVPLDSYTLNWFRNILAEQYNKRNKKIKDKFVFNGNTKWSNLTEECYSWIQDEFYKYLASGEKIYDEILLSSDCLKAEFVIWPYLIWKEKMKFAMSFLEDENISTYKKYVKKDDFDKLKERMYNFLNG